MSGKGVPLFSQVSLWVILLLLAVGCSSGRGSAPPTVPAIDESGLAAADDLAASAADYNRYLWSYHLIKVDPSTNEFEVIPARQILGHWNVIQFLEQGPCTTCLNLKGVTPNPDGTLNVNVSIKHPFSNPNLTGFDVRGIAMFSGSHLFPESGLVMSDRTLGEGQLVNADGYTTLYNPTTAGHGFEGYIKGKLATGTAPNATLNGYKRFVSDDPANIRNAFYAGDEITVTYRIDMPDSPNPWIFGYAVDACWAPPISKPVDDPMTDFGPEANCPEAWKIEVTDAPIGNGLTDCGGQAALSIYVYDWQGKDDVHPVLVECPELFDGEVEATWAEDGVGFTRHEAVLENVKLASEDTYRCLVGKEAQENDPSKPWLDITAYQIHELVVIAETFQPPTAIAEASQLSAYVGETISFDASGSHDNDCGGQSIAKYEWDWENDGTYDEEGIEVDHSWSTAGKHRVQLRVTDDEGESDVLDEPLEIAISSFLWALTWGGTDYDDALAVAVDGSGNIYVTGSFEGAVDFDPGPGVDNHTSNGDSDIYITKLDSSGSFEWARTWGDTEQEKGCGIAVDGSGNLYVAGIFQGTVDFDPGPGVDNHTANLVDIFLARFDSSGSFEWARTWGDTLEWERIGVASDESGNAYVTGSFFGTVDFDPGSAVDNRTSNGSIDIFLSKFDSSGSFQWARTWGGDEWDYGWGLAVDGPGNAYVTGSFRLTVDFDPGPGVDEHTSNGSDDAFLSKFDSSGDFMWASTWGGTDYEAGYSIAVDGSGNVCAMGDFRDTVDFDPGPGTDDHTSNGSEDIFLSKFDSSGNFAWARTWGGIAADDAFAVTADGSDNVYATGCFQVTVDFDPGPGVDNHPWHGGPDAFLSKFDSSGDFKWASAWGGMGGDIGLGVAVDGSGDVWVSGYFESAVDFDPGPVVDNHASNGDFDAFLSKFGP